MSILMVSINSFLSIFFKNSRAVAPKHYIMFIIINNCFGFFKSQSHYNNNPYRFTNKQRFFNTFGTKADASCRIRLYGLIFSQQRLYMINNPETNGRVIGMDIVNKYSVQRYVTQSVIVLVVICLRDLLVFSAVTCKQHFYNQGLKMFEFLTVFNIYHIFIFVLLLS